jgi:hypothetical protein
MLSVPGLTTVIGVEFAEHSSEIFVVQVQPVVLCQFALQYFGVVNYQLGLLEAGANGKFDGMRGTVPR